MVTSKIYAERRKIIGAGEEKLDMVGENICGEFWWGKSVSWRAVVGAFCYICGRRCLFCTNMCTFVA